MTTATGPSRGGSPRTVALAAAATSVPIGVVAWVLWQVLEGDRDTVLASQFTPWITATLLTAVVVCTAAATVWRSRPGWLGVALGVVLSGVAVAVGLLVDLVTSGGLA